MRVYTASSKFLASQEQLELQKDAQRVYRSGNALLKAGKPREAATDFARAHALERSNRDYELALAGAQLTAGEVTTSRNTLEDLLEQDSNDARANLIMARAMAAAGRFAEADSYYHRAIYGTWPANSADRQASTRLELADLLAKRGAKEELLSELLLLQNSAPDANREKKLAALFLAAGSPARAADAYHQLIRKNPDDADAFAGLGQAEVMRGDYSAAVSAYRNAVRRRPADDSLRAERDMTERLSELDPTSRHLSSDEKYRRSVAILNAITACDPAAASAETKPKAITNELSESVLETAEELWKSRGEKCHQDPYDPLPTLMRKLSQ